MFLFVLIVLIAELIITANIVCLLIKLDKKVLACSNLVEQIRLPMTKSLIKFSEAVLNFGISIEDFKDKLKEKQKQLMFKIIENILLLLLMFVLKGRAKKVISSLQFVASLKDFCKCS